MTAFPAVQPTDAEADDLRRTLEYVLAHPDEYRQRAWGYRYASCRTVFCLAGHAAVTVADATPVWSDDVDGTGYLHSVVPAGCDPRNLLERRDVQDYARRVLGLTSVQSAHLFYGGNSLRRVAELAYHYTGGRVDVLDRLPPPSDRDVDAESADVDYAFDVARDDEPYFVP